MEEEILEEIGLSKNEARVYLALSDLGFSKVNEIAKKSKLHRSNVYDSLDRLVHKGLISYIQKDDTRYFETADPINLMNVLKEKELKLNGILAQLKLKKQLSQSSGYTQIYEGIKPFVGLLYRFLEYKEPILVYGIPKNAPELMKTYIPHFHDKRIPMKIPMLHIYNHDARERINFLNRLPYTKARYLPEKFDSLASTNICGEEVVITIWASPVISIQIVNKQVAETYRKYFYLLWENARV